MKKALRVGYNQYYNDDVFEKHLSYIKENIAVIDEIAMFAEFSHYGYWSLEFSKENAAIIKERIQQYKEAGIKSVGINLLCTIGHCDEGWSVFPKAPFPYQVSKDGTVSKALLCPNNKAFLEHTAKRYSIYSDVGADFIWMDDDIRITEDFCFCDDCIKEFNDENHTGFTREELAQKLSSDTDVRKAWERRKNRVIATVLQTIKEAVNITNPHIEIGYMSIYCNSNRELIEKSGAKRLRPGGGYYNDDHPYDLFEKIFSVEYQIYNCPPHISDIQYEYEAFNYQTLERSVQLSKVETGLAIMSGCTGVLYNDNIFYDSEKTAFLLKNFAEKWNTLSRVNETCRPAGVFCVHPHISRFFNEISIPITRFIENSVAAVLMGEDLRNMSDEELEQVLSKNLLTDGEGVDLLNQRGFGDMCGGKIIAIYDNGMAERFSTHSLNGEYQNHYRDTFMNFEYIYNNNFKAYEFEPYEKSEVLSNLETTTHIPGECSMYRYESPMGTRFAVDGYLIPTSIKSAPKREQLCNLLDWLSNEKLNVRIKKPIKIMPAVTSNPQGVVNIMLTNASFDASGEFECVVRSNSEFFIIADNGQLLPVCHKNNGEETVIKIENIPPWDYILLTNKKQ